MNRKALGVLAGWCVLLSAPADDLAAYADPFTGTAGTGHTHPAAACPFGMVQAGPDTGWGSWRYCSGYSYEDAHITMFSQTHNAGGGCPDYGDIGLMPGVVSNAFRHATETARPGYYAVTLDDGNDWNDHMAMLSYASAQFDTVEIAAEHAFGVYAHQTHFSNPDGIFLTVPKGNAPVISYRASISETHGTVEYFDANGTPLGKFSLCPDKNADAHETGVGEKAGVIST